MLSRILIYNPDPQRAQTWKESLEKLHLWVVSTSEVNHAMELLEKQLFHLCLWHLNEAEQTQILSIKRLRPETAVVASSSKNTTQFVVDCVRFGASHFLDENEGKEIGETIQEVLSRVRGKEIGEDECPIPAMVGRHPKIQEVYSIISRIKDSDSNVLITGESGTGKELVAEAIHFLSNRKSRPWIAINCGAIPPTLLESELFGHVKGAFTGATQNRMGRFQMARNGTLFLDEISDLPIDLQGKFLRAIQNRTFESVGSVQTQRLDARIIAATNQDLEQAVSERKFREDLFYRLNVIPIYLPSLRSRKSDIPLLVNEFIKKFSQSNKKQIQGITEEAMQILVQYNWPGNVRELENVMERVVVLKQDSSVIEPKDFPVGYFRNVKLDRFVANVALPEDGIDFNVAVNDFENELILQALRKTEGNKNQAAHLLRLNRTTLVEKLKRKRLKIAS